MFNELLNVFVPGREARQIDARETRWRNRMLTSQHEIWKREDEKIRLADIGYAERAKAEADRANSLGDF